MIFCVEDDSNIRELVIYTLETTGFKARGFEDGKEFLEALALETPELILLDIMLPGMDGLELLSKLKASPKNRDIPVIMLTAKGAEYDKVKALDAGADDYITKPFGNQELLARIRTALRHRRQPMGAETKTPMYHAGQLKIDFDKRRVFLGEEEIRLTQIEYKLVSLLAENAGKVITYESIIKDIWGPHADTNNRILRVNMANIRRKIEENPAVPKYVFTEVGVGYRMLENELNS
mgnify:CR=1 FL=1